MWSHGTFWELFSYKEERKTRAYSGGTSETEYGWDSQTNSEEIKFLLEKIKRGKRRK